jgi:hypothetical protein
VNPLSLWKEKIERKPYVHIVAPFVGKKLPPQKNAKPSKKRLLLSEFSERALVFLWVKISN